MTDRIDLPLALNTPEQKRDIFCLVESWVETMDVAEDLRLEYIKAKNAWEKKFGKAEEIKQKLGCYVGKERKAVVVIVNGRAYKISDLQAVDYAHVCEIPLVVYEE